MLHTFSRPLVMSSLCLLLSACSGGSDPGSSVDMADSPDMTMVNEGSGRCESDPIVHTETMIDTKTDPADLSFSAVTGFTVPAQLGQSETREIFTSSAAFERYFGTQAPSSIDFSKQWVFFYSAGNKSTDGFVPSVHRIRTVGDEVRVDTSLEAPSAACQVTTQVTRPVILAAFARPTLALCRSTYHHTATTRMCVPPEPGVQCSGKLTDSGIDEMMTTRPKASIPSESGFSPYASESVSLGLYKTEQYTRTCKDVGVCDAWANVPLTGDYYTGNASFYYSGSTKRLILITSIFGYQVNIGGGMFKNCFRYSKGMNDIHREASGDATVLISLAESSGCYSGGATANGDTFRLGPVVGTFADHCFRLTQDKQTAIGVNSYKETLTIVSGTW